METCIRETNNYKLKFDEFPKSCKSKDINLWSSTSSDCNANLEKVSLD
jgi:hypothetical protein